MAANYPGSTYSPRTKENKAGVVYDASKKTIAYAEDLIKLDDEVVAIETELGTNAKGIYATVKAWLTALSIDCYRSIINWAAVSDVTDEAFGGGVYSLHTHLLKLTTGAGSPAVAGLYFNEVHSSAFFEAGKKISVEFVILNYPTADANTLIGLGFGDIRSEKIGFGFEIGLGFASNYDIVAYSAPDDWGGRYTDTGEDISAGNQFTRLKAVFTPGTDIKFYVNGVLKATHTEDLPPVDTDLLKLWIESCSVGNNRIFKIGPVIIEKEY